MPGLQPLKFNPILNFIAGNMSHHEFGYLTEDRNKSKTLQNVKVRVKREFKIKLNYCHDVITCDNGTLWICDQIAETIVIYKQNGGTMTKQRTLSHHITDMQSFSNNVL